MPVKLIASWTLRVGLAALFLYAGVIKLMDVQGFAIDIANYRLLPSALVPVFAVTMPGIEVACGVCLLLPKAVRAASWLTAALMAVFTFAVGQALARGINIECGCFGRVREPVTMALLARDLGLLGCAGAVIWLTRGEDHTVNSHQSRPER